MIVKGPTNYKLQKQSNNKSVEKRSLKKKANKLLILVKRTMTIKKILKYL